MNRELRWLVVVSVLFVVPTASAQTFIELYPFNSTGTLADGGWPEAGVVRDSRGNLYGTTFFGGAGTGCDITYNGCGVVFKVDPSGAQTVLHSFSGRHDGWNPTAGLLLDSAGNLYGTTPYGGEFGSGTVFKIDTSGRETILHNFAGGHDGANPNGGLVEDRWGNLYGTTRYGGRGLNGQGWGTVFRIAVAGGESIIHRFKDGLDGASPLGSLAVDSSGNVYGTTWVGGLYGFGTVFEIDNGGREKVLHAFWGGADGANPVAGLALDAAGNLYGTTTSGGAFFGTIFRVTAEGSESVLYTFTGGLDGAYPYSTLILDNSGHLYGTSSQGGIAGAGTVFQFSGGALNVLYGFAGTNADGANAMGELSRDAAGNLYGTLVEQGTYGWGAVFEIQPAAAY